MEWDFLKRFVRKATLSYKGLFGVMAWQQYLMVNLMSPIFQMICFSLVAGYAHRNAGLGASGGAALGDMAPWLIGNALVLTYFNAIFGVGSQLTQERNTGTLILLIASPANRVGILLPRALLHIFDGLITVALGFMIAFVAFGLHMPLSQLPSLLLVLLAASFSAMSFGLIISCLGLLTRDLNLLLNIASMALLGLTGANFPLSYLPNWLTLVPWCMPLTRSIALARLLGQGHSLMDHRALILGELAMGAVFMVIGTLLFTKLEGLAIKRGSLELV